MKTTDDPIIIEQIVEASEEKVWSAITEVGHMNNWFFDNIPDFKAEVGFETQFIVKSEDRQFTHLWKVTEVIPHEKITYSWRYEEYPGDSLVTFKLDQDAGQITLTLSLEILEDFDDTIPEFTRESGVNGWSFFIQGRLKEYLES